MEIESEVQIVPLPLKVPVVGLISVRLAGDDSAELLPYPLT